MLLAILSFLSATVTAVVCAATGAFYGYMWLWLVPSVYLGSFLVFIGLAFLFLLLVCKCIDPEKNYEKDSLWFRRMVLWYIDGILTILPIKIRTRGLEKLPKNGRFLLVCNHLHNIDPVFLLNTFPKSQLSFVAKQETKQMFLLDKVLPKLLCPYINRENDREALKTILRCIQLLKTDTVSIAIFPEGGINPYRKLAHFRPGVFKIAQKAEVPIVVCTLRNTQYALAKVKKLQKAEVELHLLDVIPVEEHRNKTTVEVAERIYTMMADDLGPENVLTPEEEENT